MHRPRLPLPTRMSVVVACGVRVGCDSPHSKLRLSVPMLMMSTRGAEERVELEPGFAVAIGYQA